MDARLPLVPRPRSLVSIFNLDSRSLSARPCKPPPSAARRPPASRGHVRFSRRPDFVREIGPTRERAQQPHLASYSSSSSGWLAPPPEWQAAKSRLGESAAASQMRPQTNSRLSATNKPPLPAKARERGPRTQSGRAQLGQLMQPTQRLQMLPKLAASGPIFECLFWPNWPPPPPPADLRRNREWRQTNRARRILLGTINHARGWPRLRSKSSPRLASLERS